MRTLAYSAGRSSEPALRARDNERRAGITLPQGIQGVLPGCAESCVGAYVQGFWASQTCDIYTNTTCLCNNYSSSGYAIGEIALACVSSACRDIPEQQSSKIYEVCATQSGAVPATHTILTVLVSATPSLTSSTTRPTSTTTSIPRITSATVPPSSQSTTSTSAPIVTDKPANNNPSNAGPVNNDQGGLTTQQAVGITAAAFGTAVLFLILVFCCFCRRRRKARKDKEHKDPRASYDFVCARTPHNPTFTTHWSSLPSQHQQFVVAPPPVPASRVVTPPPLLQSHQQDQPTGQHGLRAGMKRNLGQLSPFLFGRRSKSGARRSLTRPRRSSSPDTLDSWLEKLPPVDSRQKPSPHRLSGPFVGDMDYERYARGEHTQPTQRFSFETIPRQRSETSLVAERPRSQSLGFVHATLPDDLRHRHDIPSIIITDPTPGNRQLTPKLGLAASPRSAPASPYPESESGIPTYYSSQASRTPQIVPPTSPLPSRLTSAEWSRHLSMKALPSAPQSYLESPSMHSDTTFESFESHEPPAGTGGGLDAHPVTSAAGIRYPPVPRPSEFMIVHSDPVSPVSGAASSVDANTPVTVTRVSSPTPPHDDGTWHQPGRPRTARGAGGQSDRRQHEVSPVGPLEHNERPAWL